MSATRPPAPGVGGDRKTVLETGGNVRTARKIATGLLTGVLAALFLLFWMRAPFVIALGSAAVLGFCVLAIKTSSDDLPARQADEAWLAAAPDLPPATERRLVEVGQEAAAAAARPTPRAGGSGSLPAGPAPAEPSRADRPRSAAER